MSESLIIFCREWAVTVALTGYLAQLTRMLQAYPRMPVLLGLRPHEHVVDLYRLRPLLAGRAVLFVGRCFYWTDYNLPEWLALERYGFCTWDAMQDPFSRRMELRRFSRLCVDVKDAGEVLRLKQISGLAELFGDETFSQAWTVE
ncbi:hypothetical protein F3V71_06085 [Salmonella enterica]|uniref:Uncharacterized protein n=1 Tax=Salmonella enterica TaxID=28901 RepID=A0A5Z1ZHF5_SALER|nr:hypothetical protein [Salmonella enterica]ECW2255470.1 hypothetical protein [Salmonella enterica]EEN7382069.1 hypothetical protein [Salmonella enterica]EFR0774113.1 hypothetical protein [Salmonella enterica]EFR6154260.1 hypothetical protein [Salmonella enterica]